MKRTEKIKLSFFDNTETLLLERDLTAVPLQEEAILRLSMEFFQDPEPCFLHRSAVMSRMYMELLEYFMSGAPRRYAMDSLPACIASMLDVPHCALISVSGENKG